MVKHIYPLIVFLSFTINIFSQETSIATKFIDHGSLYKSLEKSSLTIAEFEENDKCIVLDYLGKYTYKVRYKNFVGFVKDEFIDINEDMMDLFYDYEEKERAKAIEKRETKENKILEIKRKIEDKRKDSIPKINEAERKRLDEIRKKGSFAKVKETERLALIEKRRIDSIAKSKEAELKELAERKRIDSIAKIRETERLALIEKRRIDSIAKAKENERLALNEKRINDSINTAKEEQKKALELLRQRNDSIAKVKALEKEVAERKRKDAIAKIEEEQKKGLELLRKRNDSVAKVNAQEKALAEIKRKDAIAKIEDEKEKALELLRKRNDSVTKVKALEKEMAERKRKDAIAKIEKDQKRTLELLRQRNDSVAKVKALEKAVATRKKNNIINQTEEALRKQLIEKKRYDSIVEVRAQERKELLELRRKSDSITKLVEKERKELNELKRKDSIAKVTLLNDLSKKGEIAKIREEERIKFRNTCHYQINEYDKFYNVTTIRTEPYTLNKNLTVELYKQGRKTNIFFNFSEDIGCATYLPNNRSSVKVTLENNQTISFYHSWDIDCDKEFRFKGNLSSVQMLSLKKSPIKSIVLTGTKYSREITNIGYKEFFIDKLKCLESNQ